MTITRRQVLAGCIATGAAWLWPREATARPRKARRLYPSPAVYPATNIYPEG